MKEIRSAVLHLLNLLMVEFNIIMSDLSLKVEENEPEFIFCSFLVTVEITIRCKILCKTEKTFPELCHKK